MPWIKNRPLRIIIRWQLLFTLIVALGCAIWVDDHSAFSALLGGFISVASSSAFALIVSLHKSNSASGVLRTALRAEAVKIIVIVISLWQVLTQFENINLIAFIGTFAAAVIINSMALLVSEDAKTI